MESLRVDIVNPKAKNLLKDLAEMNLIRINDDDSDTELDELLAKLRVNSDEAPSLKEITAEVEAVRTARYEK